MSVEVKTDIHQLPHAALAINAQRKVVDANELAIGIGVVVGTYCWDTFGKLASLPEEDRAYYSAHKKAPPGGTRCTFCQADEALSTQKHIVREEKIGDTLWDIHWIPVSADTFVHYGVELTGK